MKAYRRGQKLVTACVGCMLIPVTDSGPTSEAPRAARERARARWALQRWEAFPVDRAPRPLVLTAPAVGFERGFRSGDAKMAFLHGDIQSAVWLPMVSLTFFARVRMTGRQRPNAALGQARSP